MASSLEKCNVWVVSRLSMDDGHRINVAWFSAEKTAVDFCRAIPIEHRANLNVFEAWSEVSQLGSLCYYVPANGKFDELPVDYEIYRKSGLQKLTHSERKALGV